MSYVTGIAVCFPVQDNCQRPDYASNLTISLPFSDRKYDFMPINNRPNLIDSIAERNRNQSSGKPQRPLLRLFSIGLAITISGCGPKPDSKVEKGKTEAGDSKAAKANAGATADDVLTSAVYQLRPENYGVNAATDKPVNLLNSWRFKQIEALGTPDEPVPVKAPDGWIIPDEATRLAQPQFDGLDAIHVRDALFNRTISGFLSDRGRDELQRAGIVVDFVSRNVAIWKIDEIELPLMPFLIMQLGRGTAEDRAWVCSEILRQLRIDCVILRARSDLKETSDKWLLGVLVENQICLYDLRLGLPIFGGTDDGGTIRTATLSEIVSHPEWLQQMSGSEPYPLSVDDLRDPTVFAMSTSNFWCRRMHNLEQVLPASEQCVLYDPAVGDDGRDGLLQRLAKGGGWSVESLKLWRYPHRQIEETKLSTNEKEQEWQRLIGPFSVPITYTYTEKRELKLGVPERKQQRIRSDQLLGKFGDAATRYLRIRHLEVEPNPPEIDRLNRMASEDAFYWSGVCKFEMGEYETAIEVLTEYLRKYDRKGKWFFPARSLLGQSHAKQGNLAEAIATLERTSSDDPCRDANAIRLKRLKEAKAK